MPVLRTFAQLSPSFEVQEVHKLIDSDLDLSDLAIQYTELCTIPAFKNQEIADIVAYLVSPVRNEFFKKISIVFSRILAATPHSADVERNISANNLLKTSLRNRMCLRTENKYLFIHFNLPVVEEWCPKKSVAKWLHSCDRRERQIDNSNLKSSQQSYFAAVFKNVKHITETESEEASSNLKF